MNWRAYFPDDGQGPSDAVDLQHRAYRPGTIYDAEDAAEVDCVMAALAHLRADLSARLEQGEGEGGA